MAGCMQDCQSKGMKVTRSAPACQQGCQRPSGIARTTVAPVRASLHNQQPFQQPGSKPKGWDRPWIQANSQPILAPRTQDMQGDPFGLLLRQRTIFLGGEVEDFGADALISQLLLLDNQDATKDIKLFINSPGQFCAESRSPHDVYHISVREAADMPLSLTNGFN